MFHHLVPFGTDGLLEKLQITCEVARSGGMFEVEFKMIGDVASILFHPQVISPQRRDFLWKNTCFEIFFALESGSEYWEINSSPSGEWNFYHFDNYRHQQMGVETRKPILCALMGRSDEWVKYKVSADVVHVLPDPSTPLKVGLSMIVEHVRSEKHKTGMTYWALKHCGDKPDFHLRESFCLNK